MVGKRASAIYALCISRFLNNICAITVLYIFFAYGFHKLCNILYAVGGNCRNYIHNTYNEKNIFQKKTNNVSSTK